MRNGWKAKKVLKSLLFGAVCALLGGLLLALFLAGEIYDYQDTLDGAALPEDIDVIVCLAGGRGRIAAAGDLWMRYRDAAQADKTKNRKIPKLYISGMGHLSNWRAFSLQLRRGISQVIPRDQVILETRSVNTEGNAIWFAEYARIHSMKSAILLTSSYHMRRAVLIFSRVLQNHLAPTGQHLRMETLSLIQDPFDATDWRTSLQGIRVTLNEFLKLNYYRGFWSPAETESEILPDWSAIGIPMGVSERPAGPPGTR